MFKELLVQKDNLHHAYLIEGDKDYVFSQLVAFLEEILGFIIKNNPDFWHGDFETFGIDDGRKINDLQNKKSFGGKQIFVIKTNFITREAQNSLLKMFEEPTMDTHFFLIMNSGEVLLPTLKSRLMLLKEEIAESLSKDAGEFLNMSVADRLKFVSVFFGDNKKKNLADKGGAIIFLNRLEKILYEKKVDKKYNFIFEEIFRCRSYLNDRSPSVKNILEHIALIIPQEE